MVLQAGGGGWAANLCALSPDHDDGGGAGNGRARVRNARGEVGWRRSQRVEVCGMRGRRRCLSYGHTWPRWCKLVFLAMSGQRVVKVGAGVAKRRLGVLAGLQSPDRASSSIAEATEPVPVPASQSGGRGPLGASRVAAVARFCFLKRPSRDKRPL